MRQATCPFIVITAAFLPLFDASMIPALTAHGPKNRDGLRHTTARPNAQQEHRRWCLAFAIVWCRTRPDLCVVHIHITQEGGEVDRCLSSKRRTAALKGFGRARFTYTIQLYLYIPSLGNKLNGDRKMITP